MKPFNENGVDFGRALREGYDYLRFAIFLEWVLGGRVM